MPLHTTYDNPTRENVESLLTYLNTISGRPLSIGNIRQNIFKVKWYEHEFDIINRGHFQAAVIYLEYLLENVTNDFFIDSVQSTIADINSVIKKQDIKVSTGFVRRMTTILPSNIHYRHSEWLFYNRKLMQEENRHVYWDLLTLYSLRLSLEKRILSFLGIDFIEQNGKPIGFSSLFPIVISLKSVKYNDSISWVDIQKVNKWLNHYMHRHIRPYPWVIHQAFEVLNPVFLVGDHKEGNTTYSSIFASTIVKDESKLHTEIEEKLNKTFPNADITWKQSSREILKTNPL